LVQSTAKISNASVKMDRLFWTYFLTDSRDNLCASGYKFIKL
jgi:hypothetical protein